MNQTSDFNVSPTNEERTRNNIMKKFVKHSCAALCVALMTLGLATAARIGPASQAPFSLV